MRFHALLAISLLALPAAAHAQLKPGEQTMMVSTCSRLPAESTLCRRIANDPRVTVNGKRSCLLAITLLLKGTAWAKLKSLPPTLTCKEDLARAGYPVAEFIARWSRASAQR